MAAKKSALAVFVAAVVMFWCSTFVAQLWDMAATVGAALWVTAALLLFVVGLARKDANLI
jgi:hypothetical protein